MSFKYLNYYYIEKYIKHIKLVGFESNYYVELFVHLEMLCYNNAFGTLEHFEPIFRNYK